MISKNKFGAIFVGAVLALSVIAISETFRLGYAEGMKSFELNAKLKPGTYKEVYKKMTTSKLPNNGDYVWGVYPDTSDCSALQVTLYPDYITDVAGYKAVTFKEKIRVPEYSTPYSEIHCEVSFWEVPMKRGDRTVDMAYVKEYGDLMARQVIWIKVLQPYKCHDKVATYVGTQGDDYMTGTDYDDVIVALGGNDHIVAGYGNDIICAGDGNDKVYSDYYKDTYRDGNDKVILGKGNDYAVLGGGYNEAFGGPGNDYIRGGPSKDKIGGGPGYDELYGQAGDDYLNGNSGYDHLYGGYGGEVYGDVCKNGEKFYNCEKKIYGI